MKKLSLLIYILLFGFSFSFAQNDEAKMEKRMKEVQEYKMKCLAQEMELTEPQKKQFFEVYGEMIKARSQCYKDLRQKERKVKKDKDASESDYQQLAEAKEKANSEWLELEKKYNEKFSEFLSQKQIFKMGEAEAAFKARLNEMKKSRSKDSHHKGEDKR